MAAADGAAEAGDGGRFRNWLWARLALGRLAWAASPALVVAASALSVVGGLLPAAFNVASGVLIGFLPDAVAGGSARPTVAVLPSP